MKHKIIEASNPGPNGEHGYNWGKFLLLKFEREEWKYKSVLPVDEESREIHEKYPLLAHIGFNPEAIFVLDLQTTEGAAFVPKPHASPYCDLHQKRVWVCPMFEPFLKWLYRQDTSDLHKLPSFVELVGAEGDFRGYRREGHDFFEGGEGI